VNSHWVTITGYLVVLGALGVLEGAALLGWPAAAPVPTLRLLLRRIMRTRAGRIGVLAAWAWLGLHFFGL
jgi:hypothetical protein